MSVTEALFILGLPEPVFDETVLKDRFRELAKKTHPDRFQSFTEQSLAAEEFIRIKEAYDVLVDHSLLKGGITSEQPLKPNPKRGVFRLPNWEILLELEKALSFIYWIKTKIASRTPIRFLAVFKPVQITSGTGFLIRLVTAINLIQLGVVTCLFAASFVTVFLLGVVVLCSFVCFVPAFLFYLVTTKILYGLFAIFIGFKPSAYCGNKKGEMAYLTIRSIPVILIDIFNYFLLMHTYLLVPLKLFWPLSIGLILWICMLNLSVSYEWICQYRLRKTKHDALK
jgi:hypothetical protein